MSFDAPWNDDAFQSSERGVASPPGHRYAVRLERSQPILEELRAWLDEKANQVLPKGLLGEAIHYTRNQWPILSIMQSCA